MPKPNKKIYFHVFANKKIGLGHIYRVLSISSLFKGQTIKIFCKTHDLKLISDLTPKTISVISYTDQKDFICKLKVDTPNLLINDVLNTSANLIKRLKVIGCNVINFEDLGSGAPFADLVINELYDLPLNKLSNVLWGHRYYLIRDEFLNSKPNLFSKKVQNIVITFGGTDPNNFSKKVIDLIYPFCKIHGIKITLVVGIGYQPIIDLKQKIKDLNSNEGTEIILIRHAGKMSKVMSRADIAIASNGRTVYELAHMNIPSIVVSHHERELTHTFAEEKNGFLSVGIYRENDTDLIIMSNFKKLVEDVDYRKRLYKNTTNVNFVDNKIILKKTINKYLNEI